MKNQNIIFLLEENKEINDDWRYKLEDYFRMSSDKIIRKRDRNFSYLKILESMNSYMFHFYYMIKSKKIDENGNLKKLSDYSKYSKLLFKYERYFIKEYNIINRKLELKKGDLYGNNLASLKIFKDSGIVVEDVKEKQKSKIYFKKKEIFTFAFDRYYSKKKNWKYEIPNIKYINKAIFYKKIILFNYKFVEKNKDKFILIIDGKEMKLKSSIEQKLIKNNISNISNIKLKQIKDITDISSMFKNCSLLKSLPDISKIDTSKVTDMSYIFYDCESLESIPDISEWKTNNVKNMHGIFLNCKSLISLPDLSKWNTNNVTDMGYIFGNCYSLKSLPDISKWNTSKVTKMNGIFS